jgi:CRP/FNR family transcriptional regulator, cyclic AMP receptor protein
VAEIQTAPPPNSLEGTKLLEGVPADVLDRLTACCNWLEFKEDEILVDRDDTGTSVFFVIKGKLRVMDFMGEEQQVSLADLGPGDAFGELAAVDRRSRSARVTAIEPVLVAEISSEDFHALLHECPKVTFALLTKFAGIIRDVTSRVTAMSTMTPHQRVYHELIRLAEPDTEQDGAWIIENAPNHTELSFWVGTDKQTVADAIGNLARSGIVERKHKNFIIKDHARLQRLANQ